MATPGFAAGAYASIKGMGAGNLMRKPLASGGAEAGGPDFSALLGKALDISRALKPTVSSRIVTTLVGGDLAALASGPGVAMLSGLELLPLGLFNLGDLQACIEGGRSVHLVLPGAMEPALAHSRLAGHPALASLVFVHRANEPRGLPAIDRPDVAIVDIEAHSAGDVTVSKRQGSSVA